MTWNLCYSMPKTEINMAYSFIHFSLGYNLAQFIVKMTFGKVLGYYLIMFW